MRLSIKKRISLVLAAVMIISCFSVIGGLTLCAESSNGEYSTSEGNDDNISDRTTSVDLLKQQEEIKQNGILSDDFSNSALSSAMWKTSGLGFDKNGYNTTTTPKFIFTTNIYSAVNNYTYNRYAFSEDTVKEPTYLSLNTDDGKAKVNVASDFEGVSVSNATGYELQVLSMLTTLQNEYIPQNIKSYSGKLQLKAGTVLLLYGDREGYNYPLTEDNDDSVPDTIPTYGLSIKITDEGKASFAFRYLKSYSDKKAYCLETKTSYASIANLQTLSTGNLDMTKDDLYFDISFEELTEKDTNNTLYIPRVTLSDGTNTLSGLLRRDETFAVGTDKLCYPTSLTGLSISQYIPEDYKQYDADKVETTESAVYGKYQSTVTIDDIQVVGETPNVLGASIKTTENADEQDIRFCLSFDANSYLIDNGYTVKGYGAVVAFSKALPANEQLTINSEYTEIYKNLGYNPVVKRVICNELPLDEVYVNIGSSAAKAENLGVRYKVRSFAIYEKEGEELIIYSQNNILGKTQIGECCRSIFSTGKIIANAIQTKSKFVAEENYLVRETAIPYTTIDNIIKSESSNSQTVISGGIKNGEALLAFTAKHSSLL